MRSPLLSIARVAVGCLIAVTVHGIDALASERFVDDRLIVKLSRGAADRAAALPEMSLPTGVPGLEAWRVRHGINDGFRLTREHGVPVGDWVGFREIGLDRIYVVRLPQPGAEKVRELVRELSALPWLEYAEPVYVYEMAATIPNDPLFPQQWAHENTGQTGGTPDADMDTPDAWDAGTGTPAVTVAVIDSGADVDHPDLRDNLLVGFDFTTDTTDTDDPFGHGTGVSGNAAARGGNAIGVAGICWRCKILPLQVFGSSSTATVEEIADAVRMAGDRGADVINLSLTGGGWSQAFIDALDYSTGLGALPVAAAGNAGVYGAFLPAAYPNIMSVQATDEFDLRFGSYNDLQDVAAPSLSITTDMGGTYDILGGTSAACPQVAGLAALLRTIDPSLHTRELWQLVRLGAEDQVGSPDEDTPGWDPIYGYGRINAAATVALVDGPWVAFERPHSVCGGTITVEHKDPAAGASVDITLTGDLGGDVETVTVLPVTAGGFYSGAFPVAWAGRDGPVSVGDGKLDVEHGETVTASVGAVASTATFDCMKHVCLHDVPIALRSGDCDEDGALDPGELWTVAVRFVNDQTEPMLGLTPVLETTSPDVEILAASYALGDLIPYGVSAAAEFLVRVPAGAPANVQLPMQVDIKGLGWESDVAVCQADRRPPAFTLPGNRDHGTVLTQWDFDDGTAQGWSHAAAQGTGDLSECLAGFNGDEWSSLPVTDRSHSGAFAMRFGDGTDYNMTQDAALVSPQFSVSAAGGVVGFHLWIDSELSTPPWAFDGLVVESKQASDTQWSYLPEASYNAVLEAEGCFGDRAFPFGVTELVSMMAGDGAGGAVSGDSFDREHQVDLQSLAGQPGQVRFRFGADTTTPLIPGQGVWVDTVTLYGPYVADSWPGSAPATMTGSTAGCPTELDLSWDAVAGAAGYNVYRSGVSCADAELLSAPIGSTAALTFNDPTVTPNVPYHYAVEALESGSSCPGERACVAVECSCAAPADPADLRADRDGADVTLAWDDPAAPGVTWNVYRDPDADPAVWGTPHAAGVGDSDPGTPGIQYVDSGAAATATSQYYLITAEDVCGESPLR